MNETQQILKAIQDVEKRTTEAIEGVEKRLTTKLDEQGKTLEAHSKILESHSKQLSNLEEGQKNISREVLHTKTATEAIISGLTELTKSTTSDKEIKTRLKNLEEHTGTTDPTKN